MPGSDKPIVSIVMPAFNAGAWIGAALASAQAQTERRLEILVVDDGSTDDTAAITRAAAARDARIRLLHMPCNSGPSAARNVGIAAARGDWIALLDADDRFEVERIERLLALARANQADIVSDNLLLCGAGQPSIGAPMIPQTLLDRPRRLSAAEFVERNIGSRQHPRVSFGFMQPMMRRGFLDAHQLGYDERNRFGEDFLLSLDCLLHGAVWWITPEPLYLYTVRPGSLTEVQSAADLGRISGVERALLACPEVMAQPTLRRALRRHMAGVARRHHYRAFTDAVKTQRLARSASLLFDSAESLRGILRESLAQLPRIAAKAWRGGYRQPAATPISPARPAQRIATTPRHP